MQVAAPAQPIHFIEQGIVFQHQVETRGDARVQHGAVRRLQRERLQPERQHGLFAAVQQGRHGLAGQGDDFQRAADALRVLRRQARGRDGILLRQARMHGGPADGGRVFFQLGAQHGIGTGQIVEAIGQAFKIQHGAADEQRQLAACRDFAHQAQGVVAELRDGIGVQRVDDVDQMMRYLGQFFLRRFGRADVHAAVDEGGIDGDDLGRNRLRDGQRTGRLAAGRGAHDGDGQGEVWGVCHGARCFV
ncbi:hypothetical protein D3C71_339860 [compost metagenome]